MATRMRVSYDKEGDILHIDVAEPYVGQETDFDDDWVVMRTNPETGAVENVEILGFARRLHALEDEIELPFFGEFSRPASGSPPRSLRAAANE